MRIFQSATTTDPILPNEIATKRYVDQQVVSGAVVGSVFFTDIGPTSGGIVGAKAYVPGTVPANKVITSGTADTENVRVSLVAEGGSAFYSPVITVTTNPPQAGGPIIVNLAEDTYDKRMFAGFADLKITADTDVTATSSTNAVAHTRILVAAAGPVVQTATIGAYPGTQTEAKNNDVMPITAVIANSATYAEVIVGGAAKSIASLSLGAEDSAAPGFRTATGTFTVGTGSGPQPVTVRARNALGTFGVNTVSSNTIVLNQTFPTIAARTIAYPVTQSALKNTEAATVTAAITNADTVAYTTSADLSVTDPNTYAATKTVTRTGGAYVVGTNNYTITATKTSNGAVTVATAAVSIANAAPTAGISIVGSPTRLTSGLPSGTDYTVRVTPNQLLNAPPVLVASSGTWQGSWTFSGGVYSRVLRIVDADADGNQTFNSMVLTNIANVSGNTITSGNAYVVGGFARRTLTFAPFSQTAPIGTNVANFTKVAAQYTGSSTLTRRTDTTQFFAGFTITNADGTYNPNGGYLFLTDAEFAGSNTTGTLQVDIEEVA